MSEYKSKKNTRWGLTLKGEDCYFSTKQMTIKMGKNLIKVEHNIKMFEEYELWDISHRKPILIDKKRFDRTILIQDQFVVNQP